MALQRDTHYPGRYSTGDAAHPQGAFKNRTTPTSQDGSYLEKDWLNDWDGFFASLLNNAGLTPDGNIDGVGASQYFSALQSITKGTYVTERNGYQKLPSGLIIQWGIIQTTSGSVVVASLPITFPTTALQGVVSHDNPDDNLVYYANISFPSASTIKVKSERRDGAADGASIRYIVVGV